MPVKPTGQAATVLGVLPKTLEEVCGLCGDEPGLPPGHQLKGIKPCTT
jgi:hypothetical protein